MSSPRPSTWYPCGPPQRADELFDDFVARLLGQRGFVSPYDHVRSTECALAQHTDCPETALRLALTDRTTRDCRCPCHDDVVFSGDLIWTTTSEWLSRSHRLPLATACRLVHLVGRRLLLDAVAPTVGDLVAVVARDYRQPVDPGLVRTVLAALHELETLPSAAEALARSTSGTDPW